MAARFCDLAQWFDPHGYRIHLERALQAFKEGNFPECLDRLSQAETDMVTENREYLPRDLTDLHRLRANARIEAAGQYIARGVKLSASPAPGAADKANDVYNLAEKHIEDFLDNLELLDSQGDPNLGSEKAVLEAKAWLYLGDVASSRQDYEWSVASYRVARGLARRVAGSRQVPLRYKDQVPQLCKAASERLRNDGSKLVHAGALASPSDRAVASLSPPS